MKTLPPLATRDRVIDAVLVVACGILQGASLAAAAFATRDAFASLHGGEIVRAGTMLELALAGTVGALCLLVSRHRAEALGQSYAIALRRVLYEQIASLPKSRHQERRVGALSLRFVGDLSAARLWYGRGLPDVVTALLVLPGAILILFALDPALARIGLVPLGLALLLMGAVAWHLEHRHRQLRQHRANIAISMIERIAIAPELDLMGRTDKELRSLDRQGASLKRDAVARRGRTAGLQAILKIGVAFSGLAMLWLAGGNGTAPAAVAASLSVLALVALPLQDLGAAWDHYCAWRVAKGKAQRLMNEPIIQRQSAGDTGQVSVTLRTQIGDKPVQFSAHGGAVSRLRGRNAKMLSRLIAGLDRQDGTELSFNGQSKAPRVSYIGDDHIGLQGSLRRSATLSARKRPKDKNILAVLSEFGLDDLLAGPRGLEQRIAENGKGLTPGQSLRLDLSRAVLGRADVIVICSVRWLADPEKEHLLAVLRRLSQSTVILADAASLSNPSENAQVT